MVGGLGLAVGSRVLGIAAGTGSITRLMQSQGLEVISVDQNREMTAMAQRNGATVVLATAERLPFADGTFDGVAFGYLCAPAEVEKNGTKCHPCDSIPECLICELYCVFLSWF